MSLPDAHLPAISNSLLTVELVRMLNGASLYLSRPHILIEVRLLSNLQAVSPRADRCQKLSHLLQSSPQDPLSSRLATADVPETLGLLVVLLQQNAGFEVRDFKTVRMEGESAKIAIEYLWAPAAEVAMRIALQYQDFLVGKAAMTDSELRETLARYLEFCAGGPRVDQRYLYDEARRHGIPVAFISRLELQFGHGHKVQRMRRALTDRTSHLAVNRATDKTFTINALNQAGLPVPEHVEVKNSAEAVAAAGKIGFPVVVKPVTTDRGVGVTTGITTSAGVVAACNYALRYDKRVAVERFVPGETFRFLVVNGKFVAASRTEPTPVIGDGKRTIRDLVMLINASRQRGPDHLKPLTWLEIDEEAQGILKSLGLSPESVLPFGRTVRLRTISNLSRGGQSVSVTEDVHPDNRRLAENCANLIGLDLAGIDFRAEAIDGSWRDSSGAVIEVNPSPGLRMHFAPSKGPASDVASPIFEMLFPNGKSTKIPLIAVTGTNGKTTTTRMIAHVLRKCGYVTGRTTTEEAAIDDDIIMSGDCAGPGHARRILAIPYVEAAVLETARGGIIKYGLGYEKCDVAVVLNVEADHLGENDINTLEDLAGVKQVVAQSAERAVILNADDDRCLGMRTSIAASSVVLFSMNEAGTAVVEHVATGGTAYVLSGEGSNAAIWRLSGGDRREIVKVGDLPITLDGKARHNIQNAMAGLAALEQLGLEIGRIVGAAKSFAPTPAGNPGRLNRIDGFPFAVVLDYAHNKHGFEAIAEFVNASPVGGRKICVVTMNAARNADNTAQDAMKSLADTFDAYVTCAHRAPNKRREGFAQVLRQGLTSSGVPDKNIYVRESEEEAIHTAFEFARPGDLVMILLGYDPQTLLRIISSLIPQFGNRL